MNISENILKTPLICWHLVTTTRNSCPWWVPATLKCVVKKKTAWAHFVDYSSDLCLYPGSGHSHHVQLQVLQGLPGNIDQSDASILTMDQSQERNTELCLENSVVQPLLTDLYQVRDDIWGHNMRTSDVRGSGVIMWVSSLQLTMAYAYWKSGKTNDIATFDLYFRCGVAS